MHHTSTRESEGKTFDEKTADILERRLGEAEAERVKTIEFRRFSRQIIARIHRDPTAIHQLRWLERKTGRIASLPIFGD